MTCEGVLGFRPESQISTRTHTRTRAQTPDEQATRDSDTHTRTEYASFHPCYGQIAYYNECGIHVTRIEFGRDHIEHGRIDHLASNGRVVSREFKDPHYNCGRIYNWDEEGNCEMVFALSHELRGQGFLFTFDGQCVKRYYGLDDEICNVV